MDFKCSLENERTYSIPFQLAGLFFHRYFYPIIILQSILFGKLRLSHKCFYFFNKLTKIHHISLFERWRKMLNSISLKSF